MAAHTEQSLVEYAFTAHMPRFFTRGISTTNDCRTVTLTGISA